MHDGQKDAKTEYLGWMGINLLEDVVEWEVVSDWVHPGRAYTTLPGIEIKS